MKKIFSTMLCLLMIFSFLKIESINADYYPLPGTPNYGPYELQLNKSVKVNHVGDGGYRRLGSIVTFDKDTILILEMNTEKAYSSAKVDVFIGNKWLNLAGGIGYFEPSDILYKETFTFKNGKTLSKQYFYLPKGKYTIELDYDNGNYKEDYSHRKYSYKLSTADPKDYILKKIISKYNLNGGKGLSNSTVYYVKNGVIPYIANTDQWIKDFDEGYTISKTGYRFNGFTIRTPDGKYVYEKENNGNEKIVSDIKIEGYKKSYTVTNPTVKLLELDTTKNNTVYYTANWKANKFTIKYHSNGGKGTMSNSYATYGKSNKLKSNTFKRSGYTFKGWYVKRESDNKWLYTNGKENKWCISGKQPKGYLKVVYKNKATLSKTTGVNGDKVHMYAKWGK